MESRCRIELFGGLRVIQGSETHTRFRTQKAASLLAYLALHLQQSHSRELLIELFWSDKDLATGRDNLSTALAQLRRQLEPPGVPARSVIQGDWQQVRLNPDAIRTDVGEFDNLLRQARRCTDNTQKAELLQQATELYCGELLPGNYADWVDSARNRYQNEYYESLVQLTGLYEAAGKSADALVCAERAMTLIPYDDTIRELRDGLLARSGKSSQTTPERAPEKKLHPTKPGKLPAAERLLLQQKQRAETSRNATPSTPNLPLQLTRFYGREQERNAIIQLMESPGTRLVTLLGPGGVGKTRLSIEIGACVAPRFENRVWFVSLAGATQAAQIPNALLRTLRLPPDPPETALERAARFLSPAPSLIVLDNLEQLIHDETSTTLNDTLIVIQTLLQEAPLLSCITTSRIAVGLGGEQVFPITPLPVPDTGSRLESLIQNESIALYTDRARAVRPDFALNDQNSEAVAAVCRLLEGMPLAIEMAAAWVRTLSPQKMRERLEQKMDLLVSRRRDLPPRHQSLYATIEWSYDLLTPELRKIFANLSIFRRSWSLDAAENICGIDTLEALRILQEHSLIVCVNDDEPRYRFLEPLREFAEQKLAEAEDFDTLAQRHALYFAQLIQKKIKGKDAAQQWFTRLESDHDNIRAAFDWLLNDPASALECLEFASRLQPFWQVRGYFSEGREQLEAALTRPDAEGQTEERARATNSAATLAMRQMDFPIAEKYHQESLAIWRSLNHPRGEASTLVGLGAVFLMQRDLDTAYDYYCAARVLYQTLQDDTGLSDVLNDMGNIAFHRGDLQESRSLLLESLALRRRVGDSSSIANVLTNLAPVLRLLGDLDQSNNCLKECLILCRTIGNRRDGIFALRGLAELAMEKEEWDRAILLYGAEDGLRKALGALRSPIGEQEQAKKSAILRQQKGEDAFYELWNTGSDWSWEQSVVYALNEAE